MENRERSLQLPKEQWVRLEHVYAKDLNAAKISHHLLQFAFILSLLVEKGSLFRNTFPRGFGSSKNFCAEILEALRRVGLTLDTYARLLVQNIQIRFKPKPPMHTIAGQIYIPDFDSS